MPQTPVPLAASVAQLLRLFRSDEWSEDEAANAIVDAIDAAVADQTSRVTAQSRIEREQMIGMLEEAWKEREIAATLANNLTKELESFTTNAKLQKLALADLEYQREEELLQKLDSYRQEKSILVREITELKSRLDDEARNFETSKADWEERESAYLDIIQSQRRDAKKGASSFQKSITAAEPEPHDTHPPLPQRPTIQDDVQHRQLKSQISDRDATISSMKLQMEELHNLVNSREKEAKELKDSVYALLSNLNEMEQVVAKVREENELFEVLLGRGARCGEGVPLLTGAGTPVSEMESSSSLGDEISSSGTSECFGETPSERQLKAEVKALTLYIDKILGNMMSNDDESSVPELKGGRADTRPVAPAPVSPPLLRKGWGAASRSTFLSVPAAAIEMVRSVSSVKKGSVVQVPLRSG